MKYKNLVIALLVALFFAPTAMASQPYGGCWHPADIRNWSPENDPEARFNRSRVPLKARFKEPQTMKANKDQHYEGQITNATILYPTCSQSPSQGANNFIGYQPTYWQYMDKLVYWAGSASEGIIIPPPAGSIDAAHLSGVKVLGQVFFPPRQFGGQLSWVYEFLAKENGRFIYAKKLYEIAKYLGFEGWFLNSETGGATTEEWAAFIKDFNQWADEGGDPYMEIQFYNANYGVETEIMKTHKNTSKFLEYGQNQRDNRKRAETLGCTVEETFSKLYNGIECTGSLIGWEGELNQSFGLDEHIASVGLFCPEVYIWQKNTERLKGDDQCGEKAYAAIKSTFENEELVWVNDKGDPSVISEKSVGAYGYTNWRGLSSHMVERTNIDEMPFVSDMSVGVGKHRFVEGEKKGSQDWCHSGMQSVLPTWRWWIENRGDLKVSIDWDDAYNSGSSFKISGNLSDGDHTVRLYKTQIAVSNGGTVSIAYKTNGSVPELKLSTSSTVTPDVTISASSTSNKNGWTIANYDLSSVNGKTIYLFGLNLKGAVQNYTFSLGRFAILPAGYTPSSIPVISPKIDAKLDAEGGDIRVEWDFDWSDDFDHFNIYMTDTDGVASLVGQTRGQAYYIPYFTRKGLGHDVAVSIVPVMKDGTEGNPTVLSASYPKATAPVVTLKVSKKSYVQVGETATLTASGTWNPTAWEWTLPPSLTLVSGSLNSNQIVVRATGVGRQNVTIKATNEIGTSTTTFDALDVMSAGSISSVKNILLKKKVLSFSGSTNSTETPDRIIDGVTNPSQTNQKWCNVAPESWAIFDCLGLYRVYGFKIYDCQAGPESNENIREYTIEVSGDGETWTEVVNEKNVASQSIKEVYIAPVSGVRFIRLSPKVESTLRIWEFEAYGIDDINMTAEPEQTQLRLEIGQKSVVNVSYNLNGDARDKDFYCVAKPANGNLLSVGEITEDKGKSSFSIPVTAGSRIGETDLNVSVFNGVVYRECSVKIIVDAPDAENVLKGVSAEFRHYKSDYDPTKEYAKYQVSGLTDGNKTADALGDIEDCSKFVDDAWAIFAAPQEWYLAKVKVYLPNKNKGINDNDKEGLVNAAISIAIGNDPNRMTVVKTFDNLGEVEELEYIFPRAQKTKYLAVACNVNPYFYPALAEVEAFEQIGGEEESESTPAEMSGWYGDAIVEYKDAYWYCDRWIEDNGWLFYCADLKSEGALAGDDNMVVTPDGIKFKIAEYNRDNVLSFRNSDSNEATLKFVNLTAGHTVHFLAASTKSTANMEGYVTYDDNTTQNFNFVIDNWKDAASSTIAKANLGLVMSDDAEDNYDQFDLSGVNLYDYAVSVNPDKHLQSVTLKNLSGDKAHPFLYAVSTSNYKSSGISAVPSDQNELTVVAVYNLQGVQVQNPTSGIYIVRYSDGSCRKVLIK